MIMYAPPKLKDNSLLRGKCLIGGEWLDAVGGGTIVMHNHSSGKRHALGGTFFEPTILVGASADMQIFREETFGPVAPVFRFKTEQEAIRLANDTEFELAAYFYGRDIGRVWRVGEALEYGMIGINEGMISTEIAPFGGNQGKRQRPRRIEVRNRGLPRDQIPLHGRARLKPDRPTKPRCGNGR